MKSDKDKTLEREYERENISKPSDTTSGERTTTGGNVQPVESRTQTTEQPVTGKVVQQDTQYVTQSVPVQQTTTYEVPAQQGTTVPKEQTKFEGVGSRADEPTGYTRQVPTAIVHSSSYLCN